MWAGDSVFKGSRVSVWEAEKAPEADDGATIKNNRTKQKLSVILDPWLFRSLLRDLLCDRVVLMFHFALQKFISASITRRVSSSRAPLPSLVWARARICTESNFPTYLLRMGCGPPLEKRSLSVSLGFVPLSPFQDPCPCPWPALITSHLD